MTPDDYHTRIFLNRDRINPNASRGDGMTTINTTDIASAIRGDITANADAFSERVWDYVTDLDAGEHFFSFAGYTDPTPMTSPEIVRVTLTIMEHLSNSGLSPTGSVRIIAQNDKITFNINAREVPSE